jgi:hypothetical protein
LEKTAKSTGDVPVYQMSVETWDAITYWSLFESELQPKHKGKVKAFPNLKTANQYALEDLKTRDPDAHAWLLENRDLEEILADRFLFVHKNRGVYPLYKLKKSLRDVFPQ